MPNFSSTPASSTEPAVGASTWASGSHVWSGKQRDLDGEGEGERREQPDLGGPPQIEVHQVGEGKRRHPELRGVVEGEGDDRGHHQADPKAV